MILKVGMAWCKEQILVDKAIIKVAHAASPRCFAKLSDKICNKMQISNMLSLKTSSLPFKSCQLVAFIVKCNIIMFLWLSLTLNLTIWMCVMWKCMAAMRCHNIHLNFQVSFPHNLKQNLAEHSYLKQITSQKDPGNAQPPSFCLSSFHFSRGTPDHKICMLFTCKSDLFFF